MKLVVLYRSESDHGRDVEEFINNFKYRDPQTEVQTVEVDSVEGDSMARLYGIVRYPAVMVTQTDGSMQKLWEGEQLPTLDDIESYLVAQK